MKVNRKVVTPRMSGVELIRNAQVFLPVRRHKKKDKTYIAGKVECLESGVYKFWASLSIQLSEGQ